jgi:GMP synthase (glutamine-hydrolysing)
MKPILILQQVPHETLGSLEHHFRRAGLTWRYLDLFREVPETLDLGQTAGLVVLGGPMNVDQVAEYPFLATEVGWIRQAVETKTPVLGICLGAQLLAKSLGAKVYPNGVKEIGWYEIEVTPDAAFDRLFAGSRPRETVFEWHGDTFDLPPGAVHLATTRQCRHQAFRFGPSAWGLQFHVEMTRQLIEQWLAHPENCCELAALDYIDPAAIRAAVPEKLPAMEALGRRVLSRFAALCRGKVLGLRS